MSERLPGYEGKALKLLEEAGAAVGDDLVVEKGGKVYEGILMPRIAGRGDSFIVLKLKTGYNIGLSITADTKIRVIGAGVKPAFVRPGPPPTRAELPTVVLVSTGGTIASRVDYRSGAVEPALDAADLFSVVPELAEIANVRTDVLFNVLSENLTAKHWGEMARRIGAYLSDDDVKGVVVAHGTDTLGYSAAALSFALQNPPAPVLLVGAQRSSDRPSSDAASNLMGAVHVAAEAPFAEVAVAMHAWTSDEALLVSRGTKVRKCHTSRRDAFRSINATPLGRYTFADRRLVMLRDDYRRRQAGKPLVKDRFDDRVALVKFYPGMKPHLIEKIVELGYRGLILEGTGLGHVGQALFDAIARAIKDGVLAFMASQCIWGRVNMNVYAPGRDLQKIGVIPLEDMLPETALVKLMWSLGQTQDPEEVKRIMLTNIAGEIEARSIPEEALHGEGLL